MKFVSFDIAKSGKKYETNEKAYSSSCNCGSCNCNCGGGGSSTTKCSKQAKINLNTKIERIYNGK